MMELYLAVEVIIPSIFVILFCVMDKKTRSYRQSDRIDRADYQLLGTTNNVGNHCAIEENVEKENSKIAREIQNLALQPILPQYPNRNDFDVFALLKAAKEVGGDFYDYYFLDQNRFAFLIADVSGKGIYAAMFMMKTKTVIRNLAESGLEVQKIFTEANKKLYDDNEQNMFATAWMGILNLQTGHLSYASAGHKPPLIRQNGKGFEMLKCQSDLVLGGMEWTQYKMHELTLSPGDEVFLYTDGVTDVRNFRNEKFTVSRMIEQLNLKINAPVKSYCSDLLDAVEKFSGKEQSDDITILALRLKHLQTRDKIIVYPDIESTDVVWNYVDSIIGRKDISRRVGMEIKVCTDEIYSNIIHYSQATVAEVACNVENDYLHIVFRDNGIAFDPTSVNGQESSQSVMNETGLSIVKRNVDSMKYCYENNKNVLQLIYSLKNKN